MAIMQPLLGLDARSLPESLRILARYGDGPTPGTVVLDMGTLERFAAAAQELLNAAEDRI